MALNIKNEEVYRLARKLADQLGVSMTEAVRVALEQAIRRNESPTELEQRRTQVHTLLKEIRLAIPNMPSMREIDEEMYDEMGLPR
ncbi:hypothetical protein CCB80_01060 [Armatimonadetes bacterium Uphvl-Ar1]|nr:hypothetical protein CCB80_01060 [Armatimonadetes bacterium Uphvl-Ar1]